MQTAEAIDDSAPLDDAEYNTLEQTLLESQRGRRFLKEYLQRHKTPETREILAAIQRMENSMTRQRRVPNLDQIRLDIADMHDAIERTKNEIANIKAEEQESNRFVDASYELDAIISQTEGATQTILEAAEQIQEQAWVLREAGASSDACDEIDAKATEIFMACSFQDLTGQRTNKVVQVLRYLESRINMMINIWGIEDGEAATDMAPEDHRPDAHLLNGPQRAGKGESQDNVDDLFNETSPNFAEAEAEFEAMEAERSQKTAASTTVDADFDFDAIDIGDDDTAAGMEADGEADADLDEEDAPTSLNADDIDKLFDAAAETTDDDGDLDVAAAVAEEDDVPEFTEDEAGEDMNVLDEAAIDRLFEEEAEKAADQDWETQDDQAAAELDEENDPLKQMSEAERQALFN